MIKTYKDKKLKNTNKTPANHCKISVFYYILLSLLSILFGYQTGYQSGVTCKKWLPKWLPKFVKTKGRDNGY